MTRLRDSPGELVDGESAPPEAVAAARSVAAARVPATTVAAAVAVSVLAVLLAAAVSGALAPTVLLDPGPAVRWGLVVSEVLVRLAALATVGGLLLCTGILAHGTAAGTPGAAWSRSAQVAAVAAVGWTSLQAAHLVLVSVSVTGGGAPPGGLATGLVEFLTGTEVGAALGAAVVLSAGTAVLAVTARTPTGTAAGLAAGVLALLPTALAGHASSGADHHVAAASLWLHLSALSAWVGGLAVLALLAGRLGGHLPHVVGRFSVVAGWSFAVVAATGLLTTVVQLEAVGDLVATSWGRLLLVKVLLVAALGLAGWWHRRSTIPGLARGGAANGRFWRLVAVELLVMGTATGVSVALGQTPPPVGEPARSPSPALAGDGPLPPEPTAAALLTETALSPVLLLAGLAGLAAYLRWYVRLRRRGDRWPGSRVLLWGAGVLGVLYVTNGGPAVYAPLMFSVHAAQHVALVTALPVLLALGAPLTLALRAIPARGDGSLGPREWLLRVVHSRGARFFAHPVVASLNVAVSMALFYLTPVFGWTLRWEPAHLLVVVHFVLAGYLFANVLVGTDPGPARPPYPLRLPLLLPSMLFHTFFGLALMSTTALLAGGYYGRLPGSWPVEPVADQQVGGAMMWALGELPAIGLAVVIAARWSLSDHRTQAREERRRTLGPR